MSEGLAGQDHPLVQPPGGLAVEFDAGRALVGEVFEDLYRRRERIVGLKMLWQAPPLRHFTARFERLHQGSPLSEGALGRKP